MPPQSTQTMVGSGSSTVVVCPDAGSEMRVISGEFGGRRLVAPAGTTTRPTTDRVREAVFNSLGHGGVLDGAVVADLYAGSGAMGLEALSRGAVRCTFVERDRQALTALGANIAAMELDERVTVVPGDVLAWLPGMRHVDIVFVDPPYTFDAWDRLLDLVGRAGAHLVVAEASGEVAAPPAWAVRRSKRYGRSWVTILEPLTSQPS